VPFRKERKTPEREQRTGRKQLQSNMAGWALVVTPVILTIQEAEIRRVTVQSSQANRL
jgi:hypothetical protein